MMNSWINVVGTGAWGTALACHFAKFGPVRMIARDEARAAQIAEGHDIAEIARVLPCPANIRLGAQFAARHSHMF
jgi:Glycerol-3-phosphate dehydrogenase